MQTMTSTESSSETDLRSPTETPFRSQRAFGTAFAIVSKSSSDSVSGSAFASACLSDLSSGSWKASPSSSQTASVIAFASRSESLSESASCSAFESAIACCSGSARSSAIVNLSQ